jgi:hypothetical protein
LRLKLCEYLRSKIGLAQPIQHLEESSMSIKTFFYYGVGALALIALAGYLPNVSIMFILLLIAGVALTHWQDYASLLLPPGSNQPPAGSRAK